MTTTQVRIVIGAVLLAMVAGMCGAGGVLVLVAAGVLGTRPQAAREPLFVPVTVREPNLREFSKRLRLRFPARDFAPASGRWPEQLEAATVAHHRSDRDLATWTLFAAEKEWAIEFSARTHQPGESVKDDCAWVAQTAIFQWRYCLAGIVPAELLDAGHAAVLEAWDQPLPAIASGGGAPNRTASRTVGPHRIEVTLGHDPATGGWVRLLLDHAESPQSTLSSSRR